MAILGSKNTDERLQTKDVFHYPTSKNALIIFTRNPELGKCKTRLAATIGDSAALEIYTFLLRHTAEISAATQADKFVYYSVKLRENDLWDASIFRKKVQLGGDLGMRMEHAFREIFALGYERAIIIGSDMYDLSTVNLDNAFEQLNTHDYVLGPAEDGGYYLLGMKSLNPDLFKNKAWGTESVQKNTLLDLKDARVALLEEKNDIDYYEDMKDIAALQKFIPAHIKRTTA